MKIGIISDSFRLEARAGIAKAKELGADGVQVYAVQGDICPENLDMAARIDLKEYCAGLDLEISALCGDLGGHGFLRKEENIVKIEKSNRIVDLAVDLGTKIVTTHIGVVPADTASESYEILFTACRMIGDYAFDKGVCFAIETGPETAVRLKGFLVDADSKGLGVNLDPANFVMVTGDDPVKAVHTLKDYIVHTHAKDGVKLKECDAEVVYNAFAEGGVEGLNIGELFAEVPLGTGGVVFNDYLSALKEIGYNGYLTIEREVGENPEEDIAMAVDFLKRKLNNI